MTVAADALPTVQVDGVVWQQVVVGNTVYVAGSFATARPAGAAPGVSTVPRVNLLAYDIRTGDLISSWAPRTNAQVLTLDLLRKRMRLVQAPVRYRLRSHGSSFIRYSEYLRRVLPAVARELLSA